MKQYLSFGGGVNSVALYLLLTEQGQEFESIFIDHGADYPETYEYLDFFQRWIRDHGYQPIKVIPATVTRRGKTWCSLVDFCRDQSKIPQQWPRWCTGDWKKDQIFKHIEKPCFTLIGIDAGEAKRARIATTKGVENRYPLIESDMDREGCKDLIRRAGLPLPKKSGCFICPFQSRQQWKDLRRFHPDLFCIAEQLEKASGRTYGRMSLSAMINEKQGNLFREDDFPPCFCAE